MTGCAKAKAPQTQEAAKAATVIAVAGTNRVQVQLSPAAVKRLAIQVAAVRVTPVAPLGGLLTSALLNLFILPTLYLRFAKPASERRAPMAVAGGTSQSDQPEPELVGVTSG